MYGLYTASALTVITALLHIFGAGKFVAKPLLESSLNDRAKYTNYYCWHIVTITIIAMAVCFFLAAYDVEFRELGILSSALSFTFAVWCCFLVYFKKLKPFILPQWLLFFPIAIAGTVGLL